MGSKEISMHMSLNILFAQSTQEEIDIFMDDYMPRVSNLLMDIFPYGSDVAALISQGMAFFDDYSF